MIKRRKHKQKNKKQTKKNIDTKTFKEKSIFIIHSIHLYLLQLLP